MTCHQLESSGDANSMSGGSVHAGGNDCVESLSGGVSHAPENNIGLSHVVDISSSAVGASDFGLREEILFSEPQEFFPTDIIAFCDSIKAPSNDILEVIMKDVTVTEDIRCGVTIVLKEYESFFTARRGLCTLF